MTPDANQKRQQILMAAVKGAGVDTVLKWAGDPVQNILIDALAEYLANHGDGALSPLLGSQTPDRSEKIKPVSVWMQRAEGCMDTDSFDPILLPSIEIANGILRQWAETAPKTGGYDKCDYKVTFADGETYSGRYDLQYRDTKRADIGREIYDYLMYLSGQYCPTHLSQEVYRKHIDSEPETKTEAARWLATYDIGEHQPTPPEETARDLAENELRRTLYDMNRQDANGVVSMPPLRAISFTSTGERFTFRTDELAVAIGAIKIDDSHYKMPDVKPNKPLSVAPTLEYIDRNTAIKRIREGLKKRSGKDWSVTGGRGTAWGWIKIGAPPRRCTGQWKQTMTDADRKELAQLLGLEKINSNYESIPDHGNYYREYVDRAEGRTPTVRGEVYWD